MVGVNFKEVGQPSGDLQTLLDLTDLVGIDWGTVTGGDQLMVWNATSQGYPVLYSWTGADADTVMPGLANKWIDVNTFDGTIPEITLPVGSAAWIVTESVVASLTSKGEVKEDATNVPLKAGFNMIASTLPTDVDLNNDAKIVFNGLEGIDWGTVTGGDQLMIWDATSQGYPVLYSWTGAGADTVMPGLANKWIDVNTFDGTIPTITLPVNGAAWIVRTTGTTASVDIPGL